MSGYQRQLWPGQFAVDHMQVGPANTLRNYFDQYLTLSGLRYREFF